MIGSTNLQLHSRLIKAYKATTNHTPFSLAFGMKVVMPMEYLEPNWRVAVRERLTKESLLEQFVKLEKLEETRLR